MSQKSPQPKPKPKDTTIHAPPALWRPGQPLEQVLPGADIDVKDIISLQQAAVRQLESDLEKTRAVAAVLSNAVLCLLKMLIDHGYSIDGESVTFDRELVEQMKGGKVQVAEDGFGNRQIKVSTIAGI